MRCPKCEKDGAIVLQKYKKKLVNKRRRECPYCGYRFNTVEYYVADEYILKGGRRENKSE